MPKPARSRAALLGLLVLVGLLVVPPAAWAQPRLVPINGAGSSWAANAIDNWRRTEIQNGLYVNYQPTGSTEGRNQFRSTTVDFAVSEIPYGMADLFGVTDTPPVRPFAYLPVLGGGLGFVYNLRANGRQVTNLRLSGEAIAGIFTNEITRWDDPLIQADNPGIELPAQDIVSVVRQDRSGTTEQLTRWMSARYPEQWNAYCQTFGATPPCGATALFPFRSGQHVAQQASTGVVGYVGQADGAITYAELSYALNARLPTAKVLNEAGYYVEPRADAVAVALTEAEVVDNPSDLTTHLTHRLDRVYTSTDPRAYPLSSYSYLIVPTATGGSFTTDKAYTLSEFAPFALCEGQQMAGVLGYAPLPINLVRAGFEQVARIPGAVPRADPIAGCDNPTFAPDGTNTLLRDAPQPQECDNRATGQQCGAPHLGAATTTSLTASATAIDPGDAVTLTAVVGPAGAEGTVEFRRGPASVPVGPPVETVGGVGSTTTGTLPPGRYDLTAAFSPADSYNFRSSVSAPVTITVGSPPSDTGQVEIIADVAPGDFSLVVSAPNALLAGGVVGGEATGTLPEVTVTDLRGTNLGWDLTGQLGDFVHEGDPAATIPGARLGWTPVARTVSGSGAARPGGAVAAGTTPGGLAEGVTLCSAAAGSNAGTFTCGADLLLAVPDTAVPGAYAATLTLTLA